MSVEKYEVAVVGGGPAGSAAAYTLAAAGRSVCLIDKSEFPREKLCGGLITLRSKKTFEAIFGTPWDSNIFNSSREIYFFADGKELASQRADEDTQLFFTMRLDFDAYLLELARRAGATLKLGHAISKLEIESGTIALQSGEEIAFNFLIGADGVNSFVAKTLFGASFNPSKIGFGLEVEVPRDLLPQQSERVEIDFGAARWGYGWVFPKQRSFTIGVGGIHRLNLDLRDRLDRYLRHKGLASKDFKVKGQYIPFGDFRKAPGAKNVLLCGDAAGTADPITGEGIAYAMQSGAAAGLAIRNARSDIDGDVLSLYFQDYKSIASSLRQANFWRWFIFPTILQRPFAWAFSDASTLQQGYLKILAGTLDYNALYGLFTTQVRKAIKKLAATVFRKIKELFNRQTNI